MFNCTFGRTISLRLDHRGHRQRKRPFPNLNESNRIQRNKVKGTSNTIEHAIQSDIKTAQTHHQYISDTMKYTPSLAAITILTLLFNTASTAPIAQTQPAYLSRNTQPRPPTPPHPIPPYPRSEARVKRGKSYGFGDPTRFAMLVDPVSRPNPCGTGSGCTRAL